MFPPAASPTPEPGRDPGAVGGARPARHSEIAALLDLEEASFPGDRLSRRSWHRLIGRQSAAVLVMEAGGEAEGAIAGAVVVLFRARARVARLYSIAVAGAARGKGLGRRLLEAAEDAARKRGALRLRLEVRADNAPALALYRQLGFAPIGEKPGYYEDGAAAIRLEKPLSSSRGAA